MPRMARTKSETGIYHVVLRGINQQRIFEDDEDYKKMLINFSKHKSSSGYEIYGYCLMSNHVHLLIKEGKEELGNIFRRIGASYVYWYNWKYNRRGHLFQDRYKSETIETDEYLLTVLRYIHQNPVKAGFVASIDTYHWSSYNEYIKRAEICDIEFPLSLFSDDSSEALAQFIKFNQSENKDQCLEYTDWARLNDKEAVEIIKNIVQVKSPTEIQGFEKEKSNTIIKKLKEKGLSIRQIQRLTGVSFGIIRKV